MASEEALSEKRATRSDAVNELVHTGTTRCQWTYFLVWIVGVKIGQRRKLTGRRLSHLKWGLRGEFDGYRGPPEGKLRVF